MVEELKLSDLIAPGFHEIHAHIRDENYSEFWLKGGRGSCKSSFAALQCVLGLIDDPNANAIIFRKTAASIRGSVFEAILSAIDRLGKSTKFNSIRSPAEITYLPTGQKIIMRGLDEPSKLKSIDIHEGYFKLLWFEEGEEYYGPEEIRSVRQSVLRGGDKFISFFTFNPPRNPNHWVNSQLKEKNLNRLIQHSHYKDTPKHWLGKTFIEDAERLKENNFESYQHEYDGIPIGNPKEVIFSGCYEVKEFETPSTDLMYQGRFFFGADWGFANDPTVLIRMFILNDCLYIDYEAYGYQVEIDDLPELFDKIPESREWKIYGDCSRPETISYLARKGFVIEGADKWPESVIEGIEYIKSFRTVYIHPRCVKILMEFQNYSYKIDRETKEILPKVNDTAGWDHGIDSARYGLCKYIKKEISILDVL